MENTLEERRRMLREIQDACGQRKERDAEKKEAEEETAKIKAASEDGRFVSKKELLNDNWSDIVRRDLQTIHLQDTIEDKGVELIQMCDEAGDLDTLYDCLELMLEAGKIEWRKMFLLQWAGVALFKKEYVKGERGKWTVTGHHFGRLGKRVQTLQADCEMYRGSPDSFWGQVALFIACGAVLLLPWVCPPLMDFFLVHTDATCICCALPIVLLGLIGGGLSGALMGAFAYIVPTAVIFFFLPVQDESRKAVYASLIMASLVIVFLLYILVKESFSQNLSAWRSREKRESRREELSQERQALLARCKGLVDQVDQRIGKIRDMDGFESLFWKYSKDSEHLGEKEKKADQARLLDQMEAVRSYYDSLAKEVAATPAPR